MIFTYNQEDSFLLIRLSDKCSANCKNCDKPNLYNQEIVDHDMEKSIEKVMNFALSNITNLEDVLFLGENLVIYADILYRIQRRYHTIKFNIHIDYKDLENTNSERLYEKRLFPFLQKRLDNRTDLKELLVAFNIIEKKGLRIRVFVMSEFTKSYALMKILRKKYSYKFLNNKAILFYLAQSTVLFEGYDEYRYYYS